jgi:hypothetical protein
LIETRDSGTSLISDLSITNDEEFTFISNTASDLTLITREYKIIRHLECKWCYNQSNLLEGISQLTQTNASDDLKTLKYLITNLAPTKGIREKAESHKIKIVVV